MSTINAISSSAIADTLKQKSTTNEVSSGSDFASQLKAALNETNQMQTDSENTLAEMATGQLKDLHQAALAITKAETNMKLMLEIRNKALNAYKEISRTPL